MSNKTYDILCIFSKVVLPALGTLYAALAGIWGLPYGQEIVGTIAAVDTALGSVLQYSKVKYNKAVNDDVGR